jgi:SET domain-containing protein
MTDSPLLEMRDSPGRGRGVFARCFIASRTVLTQSPVLVFSAQEYAAHGVHTALAHYAFVWRDAQPPSMALALGLGSIFNHAKEPNAGWMCDIPARLLRYVALRDIGQGEEVFICYGGEGKLWFEDAADAAEGGGAAGAGEGSGSSDSSDAGRGSASLLQQAFAGVEPLE